MKTIFQFLFIVAFFNTTFAQLVERQILPVNTDASINGSNDPHFIYVNHAVPALNKLLLFFPGTNASGQDYTLFLQTAANLGYHVIGLDYENDISVNLLVCPATRDPSCHGRARNEIWFGMNEHDSVFVNPDNSIINRLNKLLHYLTIQYPNEAWEQYLVNDTTINWQKVVTAGHSQGAGHATFASKLFEVNRVIMLSWIDWIYPGTNPTWVTAASPTPDSAYWGFVHTGDASIYNGIPKTWSNLGVLNYGPIISIDTISSPYNNTHALITSSTIDTTATQTNFHNATVVDWVTPIDPTTNQPRFLPVWEYLLVGGGVIPEPDPKAIRISPANASYIDPEILSAVNKLAFQTGSGSVWLADLEPTTGLFTSQNGLDVLINNGATPLIQSFNGPEFGMDANGWAIFYTKQNGTTPQIWRATINGNQVNNTALTTGNIARLSNQATKSPNSPSIRLVYSKGSFLENGLAAYIDEEQPNNETILDSLDNGTRWIDNTRSFVYVKQTGAYAGQIAIYDTDTKSEKIITNDSDVKTYSYGWFAPEYNNELLVFCILNDSLLSIYKNNGGAYWERIFTMAAPTQAHSYKYFGSPEPFVAGDKSYISFVLKEIPTGSSYVNAQTWVMGIEPDVNKRLMLRCDDGTIARRTDPESYIAQNEVFIYYNQLNAQGGFEIWRYATGISTAKTTKTQEQQSIQSLRIFPNPGTARFQMDVPFKDDYTVFIYNHIGKLIFRSQNQSQFDLSSQPAGIYYINIKSNIQSLSTIFIKQ